MLVKSCAAENFLINVYNLSQIENCNIYCALPGIIFKYFNFNSFCFC